MSRVLILGNRYQFLPKDYQQLKSQFHEIHTVTIYTKSTDTIIEEIKVFIKTNQVSLIILNLEQKINLELERCLKSLNKKGIKLFTFSKFSLKFLNKKNIELN